MAVKEAIKNFTTSLTQEGAFTTAVDRYLRYNLTDAGMLIHWGAILSSGLISQGTDNTVNRNRGGTSDELKAQRLSGAGISSTKGTTLPRNSIMRRTPMSLAALTQKTG